MCRGDEGRTLTKERNLRRLEKRGQELVVGRTRMRSWGCGEARREAVLGEFGGSEEDGESRRVLDDGWRRGYMEEPRMP